MLKPMAQKTVIMISLLLLFSITDAVSKNIHEIVYKVLNLKNVTDFDVDRIAYQHIEREPVEMGYFEPTDNSIATLLVIKKRKMYEFKDGFDNPKEVKTQKLIMEMESRIIPDLWVNKIDGDPDYVQITDRRLKIMSKVVQQETDENGQIKAYKNLPGDYISMYREIRNKFIQNHANILRKLIIGSKEELFIERKPLPKRLYYSGPTLYYTKVTAKTLNGVIYHAEDMDGDGLTETFTVSIKDGFSWGYKSGPNILMIYNCKYKDTQGNEKNKEIKDAIGSLAHEAYYGTTLEEEKLTKALEQEKEEIKTMIDVLYRMESGN